MPLPGISDRRWIPRAGRIRLGEKKVSEGSGKEYPSALDYFLFDPEDEALLPIFEKVYGAKPSAIDVLFVDNSPDVVFRQGLESWKAGGKWCSSGDAETAFRADVVEGDYKKLREMDCPYRECPIFASGKCKEIGRLLVVLLGMPGVAAFEIVTSSVHGMVDVRNQMENIRALSGGRLAGIPCRLRLRAKDVNVEKKDGSGTFKKTVYVLALDALVSPEKLAAAAGPTLQIAPGDGEVPDDLFERSAMREEPSTAVSDIPDGPDPRFARLGWTPGKVRAMLDAYEDDPTGLDKALDEALARLGEVAADVVDETPPKRKSAAGKPAGKGGGKGGGKKGGGRSASRKSSSPPAGEPPHPAERKGDGKADAKARQDGLF